MKYIITHCNPQNQWLSTNINVYESVGDYLSLKTGVQLLSFTGTPLIQDFTNIIDYFTGHSAGEWAIKNIKINQIDSYDITEQESFVEEYDLFDVSGNITGSESYSGTRDIVVDTIPVFDLKIKDHAYSIPNSERNWFIKSTNLPTEIESGVVKIWNTL